jgi:hypothetical protein
VTAQHSIHRTPLPEGFVARRATAAGRKNASRWEVYDIRRTCIAREEDLWVGDIVYWQTEGAWEFQPATLMSVIPDVVRPADGPVEAIRLAVAFADVLDRRTHPHPEDRIPYVGTDSEGCLASAQVDREEADTLDSLDPRHSTLLASAERWERQSVREKADEDFRRMDLTTDLDLMRFGWTRDEAIRSLTDGLEVLVDPIHRATGASGFPEVRFYGSVTAVGELRRRRDMLKI